ncbi:hypothetical protein CWI42_031190 [Ordospora colligata]|nr:hypothetical protein CWI40_031260 [Ordospora colligata]TBU19243.1 hypothetical protein CWI42_031190 [Ordospora colligata]
MDGEEVQLMEMADRVWSRADEDMMSVLRQYVFEHRFDMRHVMKFYDVFTRGRRCKGGVYEVFESYFVQERMYDEVLELYKRWMSAMKMEYEFEESMRFFRCFERMYDEGDSIMREKMNESAAVILLDLCRLLCSNAAEYECYVVSKRINEIFVQMGMTVWEMTEYFNVLSEIFIESNMLFSYLNVVGMLVSQDANAMSMQSSLDDFKVICRYAEMKNEGERHKKHLGKMKCVDVLEVLENVEKRCAGIKCGNDTLVRRRFKFGMWSRYERCVQEAVLIDENMDLIAFMKKNDFSFEINDGKVKAGGYEYKSVERKVLEICEEYREKVEITKLTKGEKRAPRRVELENMHGSQSTNDQKREVKFRDRFSGLYKKMKICLRYYVDKSEGIDDVWYEERNMAMRRIFEENEDEQRRTRKQLKKHLECIERLSAMLSSRIEEDKRSEEAQNRRNQEVNAGVKARASSWRSEPDEKPRAYVPPSVDSYSMNKKQENNEGKSISELRQSRMQRDPEAVNRSENLFGRSRSARGGDWMTEPQKNENANGRNDTN